MSTVPVGADTLAFGGLAVLSMRLQKACYAGLACDFAAARPPPALKDASTRMLSQFEQARLNLERARDMRASGCSYRQIGRQLGLTSGQLCHIRRALKREKAAVTRLRSTRPQATDRDLPVTQSVLPPGLRVRLAQSGLRTLGDIADRLADPDLPGLETIPGIGPHKARLVHRLLDQFDLLVGPSDLQAAVEQMFPELR